jgi:hypothetical protein
VKSPFGFFMAFLLILGRIAGDDVENWQETIPSVLPRVVLCRTHT